MPWLVGADDWRASYGNGTTEKNRTRSHLNGRTVTAAFYGCNRTVSYVIFTEQLNFTTAKRRNGNGRTTTECWKPGIGQVGRQLQHGTITKF